jgi:hypothetical protein
MLLNIRAVSLANVGCMNNQSTPTIFNKVVESSLDKAKTLCEDHYRDKGGTKPVIWTDMEAGSRSDDLLWVMYYITRVTPEVL